MGSACAADMRMRAQKGQFIAWRIWHNPLYMRLILTRDIFKPILKRLDKNSGNPVNNGKPAVTATHERPFHVGLVYVAPLLAF